MLEVLRTEPPGDRLVIIALLANLIRLLLWPVTALLRARAAPEGAYVTLELDGPIVDMARPLARWSFLRRPGKPKLSILRVKELTRQIAADPKVRGLLLEVRSIAAGPAALTSLRDLLSEIRASGKDVVVYLPHGADNSALYLASAARLIVVGPETMVAPLGYAAHGHYVRKALERAGVEPEVFARGTYKSAGESLIRDTMSDPQREQLGALLDARHEALVAALAQGRRVDRDRAARWIDEAPHRATDAVTLGIIDAVAYEDELPRLLAPSPDASPAAPTGSVTYRGGAAQDAPAAASPHLPLVPAGRYLRARIGIRARPLRRRPVIGVIDVHGPIVGSVRFALAPVAAEEAIISALRVARESRSVRAVILHINSPGGSAIASDRIHHEVTRVAEVKPVVAYMADVAASGGYYIAVGAHSVVAQTQTVTGSIGVVSARFVIGPLLERLGVFTDVVKRGARADLFSPSRRLDDSERSVIEREIDGFYRTFLKVVAAGRRRPIEVIEPLAEGRVYSGADAFSRGLVDHLGGFDRAIHEARELIGPEGKGLEPHFIRAPRHSPPPPPIQVPAPVRSLLTALGLGSFAEAATLAMETEGEHVLAYWTGPDY